MGYAKLTPDGQPPCNAMRQGDAALGANDRNAAAEQLGRRLRARRDGLGLTQDSLAQMAGVGVNTIIRMEAGTFSERRSPTWAKVEQAIGWREHYIEDSLAGEEPEELDARYVREPIPEGEQVQIIRDLVENALIGAAPDVPLSRLKEAQARAMEAIREARLELFRRIDKPSEEDSRTT